VTAAAPSGLSARIAVPFSRLLAGHDRRLVFVVLALLAAGLILSLAASPAAASRLDLDGAFHLSWRHAGFALIALGVMAACSQADPRFVRRIALVLFVASVIALCVVALVGVEKKGARRWLELGAFSLQPSEFAKPAAIVLIAWMLAERMRQPHFPGLIPAGAIFLAFAVPVVTQPDVGQTALMAMCLLVLLAAAKVDWRWIAGGVGVCVLAAGGAYLAFEHVQGRVNAFLASEISANSQVGLALGALANGGLFGQGPGEGVVKLNLPDAHADFIFAVAAEELGLVGAVLLMGLYAALAWIGLNRASRLVDPFAQLAASGLFVLVALQALIHIAVNVALAPAKGMTLPLVSYGGSSLVASGIAIGLALALVRDRPHGFLHDRTSP
jgi:cell division protein FtsW